MAAADDFDLDRALARWHAELDAHEALTAERACELESHVREAVAELHAKGLSGEESFLIATRRLGAAPALAEEFAEADPAGVWRSRVFWMAVGILLAGFAQPFLFMLMRVLRQTDGVLRLLVPLLLIAGMLALFAGLARGRWTWMTRAIEAVCTRRARFAWPLVVLTAIPTTLLLVLVVIGLAREGDINRVGWVITSSFLIYLLWPLALAILAANYAPKRLTRT